MSISFTLMLVIGTCLISWMGFENREVIVKSKFWPFEIARKGEWSRFVTSGFVHADWVHLGFNMFALYSFGETVERYFSMNFSLGRSGYLLFYLAAIAFASLPGYARHKNYPGFASVGASGAVSAVVFAMILFQPSAGFLFYLVLPINAVIFGVLYLAYSSWAANHAQDGIDHSAHFWGAIFGFTTPIIFKPELGKAFLEQLPHIFDNLF